MGRERNHVVKTRHLDSDHLLYDHTCLLTHHTAAAASRLQCPACLPVEPASITLADLDEPDCLSLPSPLGSPYPKPPAPPSRLLGREIDAESSPLTTPLADSDLTRPAVLSRLRLLPLSRPSSDARNTSCICFSFSSTSASRVNIGPIDVEDRFDSPSLALIPSEECRLCSPATSPNPRAAPAPADPEADADLGREAAESKGSGMPRRPNVPGLAIRAGTPLDRTSGDADNGCREASGFRASISCTKIEISSSSVVEPKKAGVLPPPPVPPPPERSPSLRSTPAVLPGLPSLVAPPDVAYRCPKLLE